MNPKHPSTLYKFLKIFTVGRYVLNIFNGATNSLFPKKTKNKKKAAEAMEYFVKAI